MNAKKKIITNYESLSEEVVNAIKKKYPEGFTNHVIKVTLPNNNFFHAITVDTQDVSYLVKVKVKLDKADKLEEELFNINEEKIVDDQEEPDTKEEAKEE